MHRETHPETIRPYFSVASSCVGCSFFALVIVDDLCVNASVSFQRQMRDWSLILMLHWPAIAAKRQTIAGGTQALEGHHCVEQFQLSTCNILNFMRQSSNLQASEHRRRYLVGEAQNH